MNNERRFARSLRLTAAAWRLIRTDRTMLALVAMSTALTFGGAALIFLAGGYLEHPDQSTPRLGLIYAIASIPLTWVGTYFNVALAAAASEAMDGRRLSLREAFAVSRGRLWQITTWTLFVTVVGILIREVIGRIPWGGRIASVLVGAAWSLATLFAIPILALEGCSALSCAERSVKVFRERWGEGLTGSLVIATWTVIVAIPAMILIIAGAAVHEGGSAATGIALIAIGAVALTTVAGFSSAAREVFSVALFRYARDGSAPGGFPESELERPLARRRGLLG